jgi:hypothetical protein
MRRVVAQYVAGKVDELRGLDSIGAGGTGAAGLASSVIGLASSASDIAAYSVL